LERETVKIAISDRGVLYTTPRGFKVNELSNTMYGEYVESPAKFKWKRIFGWKLRFEWAPTKFGLDIQECIQLMLTAGDDPVETFRMKWESRKSQPLRYPGGMTWETMLEQGIGLMAHFARTSGDFSVPNPSFPVYKDRLKVLDKETGTYYTSIPDIICGEDRSSSKIVDIKCLDRPIEVGTPGLVVNDTQLRTQAAVSGIYRVALWVFVRVPRRPDPPSPAVILGELKNAIGQRYRPMYGVYALRKIHEMTIEEAGKTVGIEDPQSGAKLLRQMREKEGNSFPEFEILDKFIAEQLDKMKPAHQIQWIEGEMKPEWAQEAIRDQLSIVPQIKAGWFPCRCGVRWPDNAVHNCPFRGLCLKEATKNPTPEMLQAWDAITNANLLRWDADSTEGL
jgi:hypothetical protein